MFAFALVACWLWRHIPIVTSLYSCPVIMCRYAKGDKEEQQYKTSKTQVSLAYCKIVIVVE